MNHGFKITFLLLVTGNRLCENLPEISFRKDPFNLADYLEYSILLADLNNERQDKNQTYKKNIMGLNNFVILYSEVDNIVIPAESGWFEFYAPNSVNTVIPLNESDLYKEDWIGLQYLDSVGKLHRYTTQCLHPDYPNEVCKKYFNSFTLPYLSN